MYNLDSFLIYKIDSSVIMILIILLKKSIDFVRFDIDIYRQIWGYHVYYE